MHLEIDRLVLTGLALTPDEAERVRAATQLELKRLLALHGLTGALDAGMHSIAVDAPTVHIVPGQGTQSIAAELAQSVYRALHRLT